MSWEPLDVGPSATFYAVVDIGGYTPRPLAILPDEHQATAWAELRESLADGFPLWAVFPTRELSGQFWNSLTPVPRADEGDDA